MRITMSRLIVTVVYLLGISLWAGPSQAGTRIL